jgi:hypothetical protein
MRGKRMTKTDPIGRPGAGRRGRAARLAAALLALTLAGCGKTPRPEDFLRVRLPHDPPTLDPALAADVS